MIAMDVLRCHRCVPGSARRTRTTAAQRTAASHRIVARRPLLSAAQAGSNEEPGPSSSSTPPQQEGKEIREYKAWGMRVIESNEVLPGPENEKDFWDGEQFEKLGEVMEKYFLPGLVVLGLVCGGIAAQTYNQGADTFMTAAKPDALPRMVPADLVVAPPSAATE